MSYFLYNLRTLFFRVLFCLPLYRRLCCRYSMCVSLSVLTAEGIADSRLDVLLTGHYWSTVPGDRCLGR